MYVHKHRDMRHGRSMLVCGFLLSCTWDRKTNTQIRGGDQIVIIMVLIAEFWNSIYYICILISIYLYIKNKCKYFVYFVGIKTFLLSPPLFVCWWFVSSSACSNMAASGRHVGHYIHRNGRFLRVNLDHLWANRYGGWIFERFLLF